MDYESPKSVSITNQGQSVRESSTPAGLSADKYVHYTGRSMYPTFHDPEFLVLDRPDFCALKLGDIIVFNDDSMDSLVIHRIIRKETTGYITRGDNNPHIDARPVTEKAYFGRAIGILRKEGIEPVRNGRSGLFSARLYAINRYVKNNLLAPLFWNAATRRICGILNRIYSIHPTLVSFHQKNGVFRIDVMINHKVIGWMNNSDHHLVMKRRYRPFVDRRNLLQRIEKLISIEESKNAGDRQ